MRKERKQDHPPSQNKKVGESERKKRKEVWG